MDSETLLRLTSQPSDQYTARLSGQTQSSSEDTYGDIDDSNEFDLLREDDPYNGDILAEADAAEECSSAMTPIATSLITDCGVVCGGDAGVSVRRSPL